MERKKILKLIAAAGLSLGIAYVAKETVDTIDSALRPTYITRGYAPPMNEQPLWQPRTNWRITIVDGRKQ